MGLLTSGILGDIVKGVFGIIDDTHLSGEEKQQFRLQVMQLAQSVDVAQMEVNKQEAKHDSVFVAGWRPFIGWVCGSAFAWTFVAQPVVNTLAFYYFAKTGNQIDLSGLPTLDLTTMLPVLMGMLGLGGLRTYEKKVGVAREGINVAEKPKKSKKRKY